MLIVRRGSSTRDVCRGSPQEGTGKQDGRQCEPQQLLINGPWHSAVFDYLKTSSNRVMHFLAVVGSLRWVTILGEYTDRYHDNKTSDLTNPNPDPTAALTVELSLVNHQRLYMASIRSLLANFLSHFAASSLTEPKL